MGDISILYIINFLPILYPLSKFYKKQNVNAFDFLILFIALYFNIIPLFLGSKIVNNYRDELVIFSGYYAVFIYIVLLINVWWTKSYGEKKNIINMTLFISRVTDLRFSNAYYVFLGIVIFFSITFYIPRATIAAALEDTGINRTDYAESSLTMAFSSLFNFCAILVILDINFMIKNKTKFSVKRVAPFLVIISLLIFFPRRVFVLFILEFFLIFYSTNRKLIGRKMIAFALIIVCFLYFIYFPFYNIMRNNRIPFDPKQPFNSLVMLLQSGVENSQTNSVDQNEAQQSRSLGLLEAMCKVIKYCHYPENGKITKVGIKYGIPSVIVGKKNISTESILERKAKTHYDQADSLFLLAYGDFLFLGSIYAVFLYLFVLLIYYEYSILFINYVKSYAIPLFILLTLFSFLWNVEGKFEASISWFFSSIFMIFFIFAIEKFKIIQFKAE